jgi:hypothetical protein
MLPLRVKGRSKLNSGIVLSYPLSVRGLASYRALSGPAVHSRDGEPTPMHEGVADLGTHIFLTKPSVQVGKCAKVPGLILALADSANTKIMVSNTANFFVLLPLF